LFFGPCACFHLLWCLRQCARENDGYTATMDMHAMSSDVNLWLAHLYSYIQHDYWYSIKELPPAFWLHVRHPNNIALLLWEICAIHIYLIPPTPRPWLEVSLRSIINLLKSYGSNFSRIWEKSGNEGGYTQIDSHLIQIK
jgi:hypothetical protein